MPPQRVVTEVEENDMSAIQEAPSPLPSLSLENGRELGQAWIGGLEVARPIVPRGGL